MFQFSHLLIGAKYSDIDDVLVEINIQQGQLHFVSFFNNLSSGVAVEIHSNKLKGHVVQVFLLMHSSHVVAIFFM